MVCPTCSFFHFWSRHREYFWGSTDISHVDRQKLFDFALHTASVNLIAWSPHESGCVLACASSDGSVSVLEFKDNAWDHLNFSAHALGVNAVSWAPSTSPGSLVSTSQQSLSGIRRFVTGGSDNLVKIWSWSQEKNEYVEETALKGHADWVRDVAWAPTVLQRSYIASASQDKTVRIWTTNSADQGANGEWKSTVLSFDTIVWRVSWSLSGNVLAVSGGDNKVTLWKENLKGEWDKVKTIDE
jgi:protein transport protein SEC13